MATNIIQVEGGETRLKNMIASSDMNTGKWSKIIEIIKRDNTCPKDCDVYCPYKDSCKHKANLLETISNREKIKQIKDEYYVPLDEAEEDFKNNFIDAINVDDTNIHIIKAQTAIGKTQMYCEYIKNNPGEHILIAVPTNNLKNEVVYRLNEMGVEVFSSIGVDEIKLQSCDIEEKIKRLYKCGNRKGVKQVLGDYIELYLKREKKNTFCKLAVAQENYSITRFLAFEDELKYADKRVVVTTHAQLLNLSENILTRYTVIVDEDILYTYINMQKSIIEQECYDIYNIDGLPEKDSNFIRYLLDIPEKKLLYSKKWSTNIDYSLLNNNGLDIASNIYDIKPKSVIWKEDGIINYINPIRMVNTKYIILSATVNEFLYKKFFGKRVRFVECKRARSRYKGSLYQYPYYSLSRADILKRGNKKIKEKIKNIAGDNVKIITFKKYKDKNMSIHFGKSSGVDCYKGKNIAVVGTPHVCPEVYKMLAYMITQEDYKNQELKNRKTQYGNYEFTIMTYDDAILSSIQKMMISSELEQSVGRARLLREDCVVYVFSNFPVEQAEFIEEDYLT